MTGMQNIESFAVIIENEKNIIQKFLEILKKEEEILIHGHINGLDLLVFDKTRLAEQLELISRQRIQFLSENGYATDKGGMVKWFNDHPLMTNVKAIWKELIVLAKHAQSLNTINGKAISVRLQHNQCTYLALQSAAGNVSLYGPKGQALI